MRTLLPLAIVAAWLGLTLGAAQAPPAAVYTGAQAAAGRAVYEASCASCHLPDLAGRNEAPALAGGNFMTGWRGKTTRELFEYIKAAMPPAGTPLGDEQYLNVTAYLLQFNGAPAGAQAFTATTAATVGQIATGQRAATTAPAAAGPPAGPRPPAGPPPARGLTVTGEVAGYVPVTDEMLRNPPPGDWLMARRTYQAWSHSPLTEITRANVKDLKLAWVWAMNEAGANQPMPLVHNGIMYLYNTGNTMQALDAKTGDLIWENQVGPTNIIGFGSMRNIAIYEDKVIFATTDARLVALDARTGARCGTR